MKTICAIATPLFNCAIHIIRVSGPDCYTIVQKINKKKITYEGYKIQRNIIFDPSSDELVDDVLLNKFVEPYSFTGEDSIEINCHGGIVIAKKIVNLLILNGCEMAKNGEFSQRSMMNKKMSYAQIESINNLCHAKNELAALSATKGIIGDDYKLIEKLREEIFQIVGHIEVNIDYPEYDDIPDMNSNEISKRTSDVLNNLNEILKISLAFVPVIHGYKIAIIGKTNVGKSSLLNALIKEDKAIISTVEGTTRDIVEAEMLINGATVYLYDTAGIRETSDLIENCGIAKANQIIAKADLIIWLNNELEDLNDQVILNKIKNKKYLIVFNKSDLNFIPNYLNISVHNNDLIDLTDYLKSFLLNVKINQLNFTILQSERQIVILKKIIKILSNTIKELNEGNPVDLIQTSFEQTILLFDELLGKNFAFNKLDELFSKFCLGK